MFLLSELQEAWYGGESIATILRSTGVELPDLALSIESGKGSTQACLLFSKHNSTPAKEGCCSRNPLFTYN